MGLVFDRIVPNAPFRLLYSQLVSLIEAGCAPSNLTVYDICMIDVSVSNATLVQLVKDLGVNYVNNHLLIDHSAHIHYPRFEKCLKLREQIVRDGIHVLLLPNNMASSTFLFESRTAPLQLYWNMSSYVYDLPHGIDARIQPGYLDGMAKTKDFGHDFYTYRIGTLPQDLNPPVSSQQVDGIKAQYPPGSFFIGSLGRLIKSENEEYLDLLLKILQANDQAIFLMCGGGNKERIEEMLSKLNQRYQLKDLEKRFVLTGQVDPHLYGNVIDLFLNSFPHSHGIALNEFMAKKRPVVSLFLEDWPEINKFVPLSCQAKTADEYVQLATKLIRDKGFYDQLSQDCQKSSMKYCDVKLSGISFLECLKKIVEDNPSLVSS